jgi:1-acyl-sn-glycerol-3-phosphate acyltransferase
MTEYSVPFPNRVARGILRVICRSLYHLLSDVRITGKENIPATGAYLITINHISYFEPPLALAFWPEAPEALGSIEVWQRPGENVLARLYRGIAVHRGEYDRKPIEMIITALQSGRPVCLAPEGRRSHERGMNRAKPGVAYIVEKTGVPVIPVAIVGTSEQFFSQGIHMKRPHVEMRIGKPVHLPAVEGKGAARHQSLQANADIIMLAIASMMPDEYHGYYQSLLEPA